MVFHLGALRRLNEAGRLSGLTRVASVSGGSIIAGVLALAWRDLDFAPDGVSPRFAELVEEPVLGLALLALVAVFVFATLRDPRGHEQPDPVHDCCDTEPMASAQPAEADAAHVPAQEPR